MKPNRFLFILLGVISFLGTTRPSIAENQIDLRQRETDVDNIAVDFTNKFRAKAPAKDYDALLQHIAGLGSLPTRDAGYPDAKINILQRFISSWQDYLIYSPVNDTEREQQALRALAEISVNSWPQLPPRSELLAVINDARNNIAAQIEAKHNTTANRFEVFRARLTSALTDAKSTTELDPLIAEISGLKDELGAVRYNDPSGGGLAAKIAASERLLKLWQERLTALSQGDVGTAWTCSREAAADEMIARLFPHSIFLQGEMEGLASFVPTNVDDLPKALTMFPKTDPSGRKSAEIVGWAHGVIHQFAYVYGLWSHGESIKGLGCLFTFPLGPPDDVDNALNDKLRTLQGALILRLLPVALELPADCQPAKNETLAAFLDRAKRFSAKHQDWHLLANVLNIGLQLNMLTPAELSDISALNLYFTAINQENAELFTDAAANYRLILGMSIHYTPLEDINLRLKRIKAEHPADFTVSH